MSKQEQQEEKSVQLGNLEQLNLDAAGLDIGDGEIWACVPADRDAAHVRCFGTVTAELVLLADWLSACGIQTVAMESTGIYWIPIYDLLESRGLEVCLVNARVTKNVSGRKTDVLDCQWIQQLHTYGLLQASFRPAPEIRVLRDYVRHRENLLRYRAMHIQHMQKALQLMNLKLTKVISDITGMTGMTILRAILAGERDPVKLAQYRDERCKRSSEEIAQALTGSYQPQHLYALQDAVELYDFYTAKLKACDAEIERLYAVFAPAVDISEAPLPAASTRPCKKPNRPSYDLRSYLYQLCGVDLTAVDGIDVLVAQDILTEVGTDMSRWPTEKHFASWLGLAPQNDVSGGKVLRRGTKPTKSRANRAFRLAAYAVARSDSALGAFYRRIRSKQGAPKANTATAHKIARIVYNMLKHQTPYRALGADHYEQQYQQRVLRNLQLKARKLGLKLVPDQVPVVS